MSAKQSRQVIDDLYVAGKTNWLEYICNITNPSGRKFEINKCWEYFLAGTFPVVECTTSRLFDTAIALSLLMDN